MKLCKVWQVYGGALPIETVYLLEPIAAKAALDLGGTSGGRFFRARVRWALRDDEGHLVLLPEGCEPVPPEDIVE